MKISHWAIIFIIIVVPFSLMCRNIINSKFSTLKDEVRLNNVVDTATQDAIDEIIEVAEITGVGKDIKLNDKIINSAIDRFYSTLSVNFNMPDTISTREFFATYVPAIVIVGYDGFYIYSLEETAEGLVHVLKPKIPYSYKDTKGNIINFTLDNQITIATTNSQIYSGKLYNDYEEDYKEIYEKPLESVKYYTTNISAILAYLKNQKGVTFDDFLIGSNAKPENDYKYDTNGNLLEDAGLFHQKRREIIVSAITQALEEVVQKHNRYASYLGVSYKFSIPEVSKMEWNNTIDDISFLAFIQGIPIGYESYYNNYALGGSRIVMSSYIYGTKNDMYYHRLGCSDVGDTEEEVYLNANVDNIFMNRIQAAESGYFPCNKCRP